MIILVGVLCIVFAGAEFLYSRIVVKDNFLKLKQRRRRPNIAILIPARDESRVIEDLLKSIERQTVKVGMENVYVIVESKDDPTVGICRRYGVNVIFRKHAEKQRKGYALDEAIKAILRQRQYDLYFIFDADNVLADNYIMKMLKCYADGYEMATGYRMAKNATANTIATVSALTFTMINVLGNRGRVKHGANLVFSGTGYYVDGELIDEWQGWPFVSLTEDYEISLYATLHGISTFYNEEAVFYDEQPLKFSQTIAQRTRWIKGYFTSRKKYIPLMRVKKTANNLGSLMRERIGIKPLIWALVGVVVVILGVLFELTRLNQVSMIPWVLVFILMGIYAILMIVTIAVLRKERLDLTFWQRVKVIAFNPIFLLSYVWCAVKALLAKDVKWKKIEHGQG